MSLRAVNAIIAIAISLVPRPALKLLDHLNRGCGDGLCGFFSGLLVLGALGAATVAFIVRSARRQESPAALRFAPIVLWLLIFVPLFR